MINLLKFMVQSSTIRSQNVTRTLLSSRINSVPIRVFSEKIAAVPPGARNGTITNRFQTRLMKKDKIPYGFQLIYRSGLSNYVMYLYHTSYSMFICGCIILYYSLENQKTMEKKMIEEGIEKDKNLTRHLLTTYAFYFLLNMGLYYICARHPLRIYYSPDKGKYRMILSSWRYPFTKNIDFTADAVKKSYWKPWNAVMEVMHTINGKTYHIIQRCFKNQADYMELLASSNKKKS